MTFSFADGVTEAQSSELIYSSWHGPSQICYVPNPVLSCTIPQGSGAYFARMPAFAEMSHEDNFFADSHLTHPETENHLFSFPFPRESAG